jgi:hypothetical protein
MLDWPGPNAEVGAVTAGTAIDAAAGTPVMSGAAGVTEL